jgi:hypothetical protein
MTWAEANAALLLLSEERVGTRVREFQAQEDAAYARSKEALRGSR